MSKAKTDMAAYDAATQTTAVAIRPDQLKAKRKLTLDATSIARLGQVICRVDSELEQVESGERDKDGKPQMMWGCAITDVLTNESYFLICNSIIRSSLGRAEKPLVGKYFAMKSGEIKAGKRYRQVDVIELELAQ